jgi:hypothetical protein
MLFLIVSPALHSQSNSPACISALSVSEDIEAVSKEFEAHVCADHPPLKNIEKPSTPN